MRSFWTRVHRLLGLATALFLIVSGLTGAVISWDHQIDDWLNADLYEVDSRGAFRTPFELANAIEASDARVQVSYLSLSFEEGHSAGFFVRPRTDPSTGRPYRLGYNQVFIDPVTAEIRGRRDSAAVSFSRENLMPFLRKLHYTLHVPALWGRDRIGYWIMGTVALVWLVDSFVALYLTTPRRQRMPLPHRTPSGWWQRWKPSWGLRRGVGGYKLNFDLHRAGGLWIWVLVIVVSFTSFSLNLYQEVFHPLLSLVSKTTPGPSAGRALAPLGSVIAPRVGFEEAVEIARQEALRRGWPKPPGGAFYNGRAGFYNISFWDRATHDTSDGMDLSNLYIDGQDGRIIASNQPWQGTAADVFAQLQLPLHSGRILGLPGRILMSFMGLAVTMLSVTGLVIWARKRRARLHQLRRERESARESARERARALAGAGLISAALLPAHR